MAYSTEAYISDRPAAEAMPAERATFIRRTYAHLAGAVAAFIGLETLLIKSGMGETIMRSIVDAGSFGMILLLVSFIGAGYVARRWANGSTSLGMQYLGLGLYVVVQAVIFLPLLYLAMYKTGDLSLIGKAGLMTVGLVIGLSTAVLVTRADFSFLRTALCVLSWVALFTILAAWMFGIGLGLWFSAAMILLASGFLVYDTSNILHHYPTTHYVGASLELFASVALLFYYILRFALQSTSRD